MEIAYASAIWCLTLWNRTGSISLSADMKQTMYTHADSAYPRECVGFLVTCDVRSFAMPLIADATSHSVTVREQDIIDYAYSLSKTGAKVLATYHSHPGGTEHPSSLDSAFAMWSKNMIILVRTTTYWVPIQYRFVDPS